MASSHVVGTGGGFTAAGFAAKFQSFRATLNANELITTGFGDKGWTTGEIIGGRVTGDAIGVISTTAPNPSLAAATAFPVDAFTAAVLLTFATGKTWAFNALITAVELGRAEEGASTSTYRISFASTGPVTQTW